MARPRSRRPSTHVVDFSDANRVPVPTLPVVWNHARYTITPLGHVYRDDGRLLPPTPNLRVNFNGNSVRRSLPLLVFRAFGHPELLARHDGGDLAKHDPWVEPFGELDPLTRRRRCTIRDVWLVPHAELILYGRYGRPPRTRLSILDLAP
jgi:hypothetical protein